jgi:hypothetical protein
VVPITSERATSAPAALSPLMPVLWRWWSAQAMKPSGITTERIRSVVRMISRVLWPGSLVCLAASIGPSAF